MRDPMRSRWSTRACSSAVTPSSCEVVSSRPTTAAPCSGSGSSSTATCACRPGSGSAPYTDGALDAIPHDALTGRRCLVTGGLGFIGSNLALDLARRGAEVTVLDARVPRHGANPFNLVADGAHVPDGRINVVEADLADGWGDGARPDVRE